MSEKETLDPKHEFEDDVDLDVDARIREDVKAVLEEALEEENGRAPYKAGY